MIGHGDDASQTERAAAGSGGSVPEDRPDQGSAAPSDERRYTARPVSRKPLGCLIEIAETLILTIVIFWLIQTFVAQPFKVQQQSMEPTLEPEQYVLVDKITPKFDSYSRGDVVVFNPVLHDGNQCAAPLEQGSTVDLVPYIKRVIGEPGDVIELADGQVYVNGALVEEPYVYGAPTEPLAEDESWTVEQGRLFVMGDNRENSIDSRSRDIGQVCVGDVVGRAFVRYWPINTFGILQTPTYPDVPPAEGAASTP